MDDNLILLPGIQAPAEDQHPQEPAEPVVAAADAVESSDEPVVPDVLDQPPPTSSPRSSKRSYS